MSYTAGGAESADRNRRSLVFSYTSWTLNWSTMVTPLVLGQITAPRNQSQIKIWSWFEVPTCSDGRGIRCRSAPGRCLWPSADSCSSSPHCDL